MSAARKQTRTSKRRRASGPRRSSARQKKEVLKSLYHDDGRKKSHYKQLDKQSGSGLKLFFLFMLFSAIVAGAVAYYKTYGLPNISLFNLSQGNARITIESEQTATLLTPFSVEIAISSEDAKSGTLSVFIPEGFVVSDTNPKQANESRQHELSWNLGEQDFAGAAPIVISGMFTGPLNSYKSFRAIVTYEPKNFESTFQSNATATVHVNASPISVELSGPQSMTVGQQETFTLTLLNSGSEPVHNLQIQTQNLDGFKIEDVPAIQSLAPSEQKSFEVKGSFSQQQDKTRTITWHVVTLENGTEIIMATAPHEVNISSDPLLLELSLNHNPQHLSPGQTLSGQLRYQNKNDSPVNDAQLILVIDAPSVDNQSILNWDFLDTTGSPEVIGSQISNTVRRATITWSAQTLPTLKTIEPQGQGVISFDIPVKTAEQLNLSTIGAATFRISSEFNSDDTTAQAQPLVLPLMSDAKLQAGAIKAGELIVVQWTLNHHVHHIKDIKVETSLFDSVSWATQTDSSDGTLSYDESSKTVQWMLPSHAPTDGPATATFALRLDNDDPTATAITNQTTLSFTDAIASQTISLTSPPLQKP